MALFGFGKSNKFYKLILYSTLFKILINIFLDVNFQNYDRLESISMNIF